MLNVYMNSLCIEKICVNYLKLSLFFIGIEFLCIDFIIKIRNQSFPAECPEYNIFAAILFNQDDFTLWLL